MKISSLFSPENGSPLIPMLVAAISLAVVRQLWWLYLMGLRGPLGLFGIPLVLCPFVLLAVFFAALFITLVVLSIWRTRSIIPTIFLLSGIVLAFIIPLPERPDTPEKQHFLEYRRDYEAVVQLAQSGELNHCHRRSNFSDSIFEPPDGLEHVSAESCIEVSETSDHGLFVRFFPLEPFYHHLVYTESGEIEYECRGDPRVEQKIDENWYVCQFEWN